MIISSCQRQGWSWEDNHRDSCSDGVTRGRATPLLSAILILSKQLRAGFQTAPSYLDQTAPIQLLDTPPRLESSEVAKAIRDADTVIVVSRPSPCDLFTSQDTAALISKLRAQEKTRLLFTNVREKTILARGLEQTAKEIGIKPLKVHLQLREAYQHAVLAGWKALTQEAREEAGRVALAIVTVLH